MSQKTVVEFVDDVDGSHAHTTVRFSLNDEAYEIDLSDENASALHSALQPYMRAGRRVRNGIAEPERFHAETSVDPRAVRHWARSRGIEVPSRARIPQAIIDQFRAAGY